MEHVSAGLTLLADLLVDGDEVLVACGGSAGRGNRSLNAGKVQNSRVIEEGQPGETVTALLTLKLVADVGLVGFPNAGKSSLLAAISRAEPKVAAYPFTTLHPQIGMASSSDEVGDPFSIADIPGIIQGAHLNRGLGHGFLRHIERTTLLCYVLDLSAARPPSWQLAALQDELEMYLPGLSARSHIIVANKADTPGSQARLRQLRGVVARRWASGELPGLIAPADGGSRVTAISALEQRNLSRLTSRLGAALEEAKERAARETDTGQGGALPISAHATA